MSWEKGARVWVHLGKWKEAGIVLEPISKSNSIGGYKQFMVQLLKVNPFVPEQLLRQTYPKPVQDHQLIKRFDSEILPGEVCQEDDSAKHMEKTRSEEKGGCNAFVTTVNKMQGE